MVLRDVLLTDCRFLYDLLAQRDPSVNISHKEMPTYEEHVVFIASHPYPYHKIIEVPGDVPGSRQPVGVVYVTPRNEVGIQLARQWCRKGIGSWALKQVLASCRGRVLANIAPGNEASKKFFESHGYRLIQETYEKFC
jgi:RimJ/RimL family protein N-acetyltransferase